MQINIKYTGIGSVEPPKVESEFAAGIDLRADIDAVIRPGERLLVPTAYAWEIPVGFVGMVCPRSGLALKHGITVLNAPGIIDSDYRGTVGVILYNTSNYDFHVIVNDRIAQMVVAPICHGVKFNFVDELSETKRGEGGFGSTGHG